ncbi:DUF4760 domain-containing protein [Longivirga aurantiaca]|uniref:DUF4760 domain-containing protein n=1 Tax=Longivirga aurantiaca TaxID=1837743 RepID=A0ABW1T5W6_9ACTN
MNVINTDGASLLGPGSEWFWTALTGLVTAVTFIAIWKQLRLQASTVAREQLLEIVREWGSEQMLRMRRTAYEQIRDGRIPRESVAWETCNYWEYVGTLAQGGHMNLRVMKMTLGAHVCGWWAAMAPEVLACREEYGSPDLWDHFEWLAKALGDVDSGTVADAVRPMTTDRIEQGIAQLTGHIRLAEQLRTPPGG